MSTDLLAQNEKLHQRLSNRGFILLTITNETGDPYYICSFDQYKTMGERELTSLRSYIQLVHQFQGNSFEFSTFLGSKDTRMFFKRGPEGTILVLIVDVSKVGLEVKTQLNFLMELVMQNIKELIEHYVYLNFSDFQSMNKQVKEAFHKTIAVLLYHAIASAEVIASL